MSILASFDDWIQVDQSNDIITEVVSLFGNRRVHVVEGGLSVVPILSIRIARCQVN